VDGKDVYGALATAQQQERGEEAFSQFRQMCARLGIELILGRLRRRKAGGAGARNAPRTGW